MATDLQRDLAKAIIENTSLPRDKRKNRGELVKSVGYAAKTASRKSTIILTSKGVQEALDDYGFNETNAKKVVSEIMLDRGEDPNVRLKATDQVFKVRGAYAPEKSVNLNMNVSEDKQKTATEAITRFLNGNNRDSTK